MAKILVVDDDEGILETLKIVLESEGFEVDVVSTGKDAKKKTTEEFYNAVLIDIILPDIKGTDLLFELTIAYPEMVKLIITGNASLNNAVEALNLGADGYFMKPLKSEELFVTLRKKLVEQKEKQTMTQEKIGVFIKDRLKNLDSGIEK